jgi:hypothetical protein
VSPASTHPSQHIRINISESSYPTHLIAQHSALKLFSIWSLERVTCSSPIDVQRMGGWAGVGWS